MPNDHGPTYVDVEGIKWRRDGSVWNCWVAEQWVPAPSANPTGLVKVDAEAAIPTCGRCGEEVLVDGSFCGSCGANLRVWQDETPEETLAVPEQETVVAGPRHFPGLTPDPFALLPSPPARTAGQERQPHETSWQASDGKWYPKWARTDTPPPSAALVTRPAEVPPSATSTELTKEDKRVLVRFCSGVLVVVGLFLWWWLGTVDTGSLSYKDGRAAAAQYSSSSGNIPLPDSVQRYCENLSQPPDGIPTDDDAGDWMAGCVDEGNPEVQNDAHPGLSNGG